MNGDRPAETQAATRAVAAWRHWREMLARPRLWMSCALVTVLFAAIGPFGTGDGVAPPTRLVYWGAVLTVGWLLATLHIAVIGQLAPRRWPAGAVSALGGAVAGVPVSAFAWALAEPMLGAAFDPAQWAGDLPMICTMSAAVATLARLTAPVDAPGRAGSVASVPVVVASNEPQGRPMRPVAPPAVPSPCVPPAARPAAEPPILSRLPAAKRGALVRLSMQDHYVEIVTEAGAEMALLRLSDAIAEAAPEPGLQVHRSHWVARSALRGHRRDRARLWLRLSDGTEIPVARARVAALETAGWLSDAPTPPRARTAPRPATAP